LKDRVERLLGKKTEKNPRLGWENIWFRSLITVWIFMAVMLGTIGGNHSAVNMKNPEWFNSFLNQMGIEVDRARLIFI